MQIDQKKPYHAVIHNNSAKSTSTTGSTSQDLEFTASNAN